MHAQAIILGAAAMATTAAAQFLDISDLGGNSGNLPSSCQSSIQSLLTEAPVPSGDFAISLQTYLATATEMKGIDGANSALCEFATNLPQPLQTSFASYYQNIIGYASEHKAEFNGVLTNCYVTQTAAQARVTAVFDAVVDQTEIPCGLTYAPSSSVPTPTPSAPSNGSSSAPTQVPVGAAVPMAKGGLAAVGAAAAGLLGVVALL